MNSFRVITNSRIYRNFKPRIYQFVPFLAAGYLGLVLFSNLPYFLDDTAAKPTAPLMFMVLLGFAALLALMNFTALKGFFRSPIVPLLLYMVVLYAVNIYRMKYSVEPFDAEEFEHAVDRLQQFLIFPAAAIVLYFAGRKTFERFMLLAVFVIPLPVIVSFAFPDLSESFDGYRGAGFYLNANQAAEGVLLWLLVVQSRFKGSVLLALFLIASVAILCTFSRSGMLSWGLISLWLIYRNRLPRFSLLLPILVVIFYSAFINNAEEIISRVVENQSQVESLVDRLTIFSDLGTEDATDDSSSDDRKDILLTTLSDALERPVFGYAREPHFSLGLSSHNILADLWYIHGVFGLFLYGYVGYLLYRSGKHQGMGLANPYLIFYIALTPFDHQHFSAIYFMVFFAYVIQPKSYWRDIRHSALSSSHSRQGGDGYHNNEMYTIPGKKRRRRRRKSIRF